MNSAETLLPAIFGIVSIALAFIFWVKSPRGTFKNFYQPSTLAGSDAAMLGFSAIALGFGFTTILGRHFPHAERTEYAEFAKMMHDPNGLAFALFLTLVFAPFTEELFYRGLLIDGFRKFWGWGFRLALTVSALLFAVSHTTTQLLSLFLFAAVLGYLRLRSGTLRTTMLAHFYNNALGMAMVYYDLPRPNDWFASAIIFAGTLALGYQIQKAPQAPSPVVS